MIREFAVDPAVAARWGELAKRRFFVREFGLGTPRLLALFPGDWLRNVLEKFNGTEVERAALTEVLKLIRAGGIPHGATGFDPLASWLENAEAEHRKAPFDALVAGSNPRSHAMVLLEETLGDPSDPRWECPRQQLVARSAEHLAKLIEPMLRRARQIQIVDPYFDPTVLRYRKSLEWLTHAMVARRRMAKPEAVDVIRGESTAQIDPAAQRRIADCIPTGLSVRFSSWRARPTGERLHNRYILTELGGVSLGHGLDDGGGHGRDEIQLLERVVLVARCDQFRRPERSFDEAGPCLVIEGRRSVSSDEFL